MTDPEVSVLIVSYNTRELTLDCLSSLLAHDQGVTFEVIVVDNGSGDGSAEAIGSSHPEVTVIEAGENLGFGRAVNLASRRARGRHLLLLNADTTVGTGLLATMVDFSARHPEAGLVGGRTLRPDGGLEPASCLGVFGVWSAFCFATGLSAAFGGSRLFNPESLGRWRRDTVRQVPVVSGCLLLVERSLWERLGGFDPRFYMYCEDVDLSMRAAEAGYRPMITPEATITHALGFSSKDRTERFVLEHTARMTLVRARWPRAVRPLGLVLVPTGVALRAALGTLAARVASRPGDGAWVNLWQRRREWLAGYPPFAGSATTR